MRRITVSVVIFVFLSGGLYSVNAQETKKPKSEKTAYYWSLGATVIPCVLGIVEPFLLPVGPVIGPSIGHIYAHQWGWGLATAGVRLGLGVVCVFCFAGAYLASDQGENPVPFIVAGSIVGACIVGSAVYDIATAPRSVRKYNESIGVMGKLGFVPRLDTKNRSYGLSVFYRF